MNKLRPPGDRREPQQNTEKGTPNQVPHAGTQAQNAQNPHLPVRLYVFHRIMAQKSPENAHPLSIKKIWQKIF